MSRISSRSRPVANSYISLKMHRSLSLLAAMIAVVFTSVTVQSESPSRVAGKSLAKNVSDLSSTDRVIRLRAVRSLSAYGASAAEALQAALDHEDAAVRYLAAEQLGELGAASLADAKPKLEVLAADESSLAVRMAASFALCRAGELNKHLPLLVETLNYPERGTACSAAALIGKIGPAANDAVAPLEAVHEKHRAGVKGGDYHRGGAAMNALRKISDKYN